MNSKAIKLLALDLDGTVLTDSNTLSPSVKLAIERAVQSGVEIVAASGRPYASMPGSILEIEGINYAVTSNGAAVHDKEGKRIRSCTMKDKDVKSILEMTAEHDLIFEAFVDGLTYTDKRYVENPKKYGCSGAYVDYVRASHGHIEDMRAFIINHINELDSVEIVCTDKKLRTELRTLTEKNLSGVFVTSSSENFIEFMDKEATKGNAVNWICRGLDINLKETSACGNADNDADMIKQSGLGAAVENATRLCLESADIIVPSNNKNGVARLIEIILEHNKTAGIK